MSDVSVWDLPRLVKIRRALTPAGSPASQYSGDTHYMSLVRKQFNSVALDDAIKEDRGSLHFTPGQLWVLNRARGKRGYAGKYDGDKHPLVEIRYTERFMEVARRVVNDDRALAALIPARLDRKDARMLKMYGCPNLAALIKAQP